MPGDKDASSVYVDSILKTQRSTAPSEKAEEDALCSFRTKKLCRRFFSLCIVLSVITLIVLTVVLNLALADLKAQEEAFDLHHQRGYHERMVEAINGRRAGWTAKLNPYASDPPTQETREEYDSIRSSLPESLGANETWRLVWRHDAFARMAADSRRHTDALDRAPPQTLPEAFDARERWPLCDSIAEVPNQGADPGLPFAFWVTEGIVTGGSYGSSSGCQPYNISSHCGSPCPEAYYHIKSTPQCQETCHRADMSLEEERWRGERAYALDPTSHLASFPEQSTAVNPKSEPPPAELVLRVKRELMTSGPLSVCFDFHEDLQHYESGVYQWSASESGQVLYGHCARLIGWGPGWWRLVNSWGRDWGEFGTVRLSSRQNLLRDYVGGEPQRRGT